jgi:uncharacterized protein YbjT (DUF2867 family)
MADSSMLALVTGAYGSVGSAVVRALLARIARHKMFFDSAKAVRKLDCRLHPAEEVLEDAVAWFRRPRMCR